MAEVKAIRIELLPHQIGHRNEVSRLEIKVEVYGREPYTLQKVLDNDHFTTLFDRIMRYATEELRQAITPGAPR